MDQRDTETKQRINDMGRQEFLRRGFKDASLRDIAKQAGVTTGAIYGYYRDKNALFSALVSPAADELLKIFADSQQSFDDLPAENKAGRMYEYTNTSLNKMMTCLYDHFDAFKLITCAAQGTDYEDYIHNMVCIEAQSTRRFITSLQNNGIPVNDVSDDLCHILANSFINSIFEVVIHDMPWEEAKDYVSSLTAFFGVGWEKLLGIAARK